MSLPQRTAPRQTTPKSPPPETAPPPPANGDIADPHYVTPQVSQALNERLRALDDPDAPDLAMPAARNSRRWRLGAFALMFLIVLVGGAGWSSLSVFEDPFRNLGLEYQPAERGKVTFTIVEKGEVEAFRNTEMICKVRNRSGDWIATTIKWLVDDGTQVKRGDLVMRLDDSALKDRYQAQTIAVTEKRALLIEAEREKEIIQSQAEIAVKTSVNNEKIARMNLDGKIKLAKAELAQWEDKTAWSSRMVKQGFLSATQAEADEIKLQSTQINLLATELELESKLEQAVVAVKVARTESEGKAAKAEANLRARATVLEQEEGKLRELSEDIRHCTITAPNDGMVVYNISEQSRSGTGSQKGILAIGEPVYESKTLLRIPDLRKMQVRVKIHESVQPRVRPDKVVKTRQGEGLFAACAVSHSGYDLLGTLLAFPELRRVAADEGVIQEERVTRPGQLAQVRVSALDRVLTGRVTWMATVASQLDAISSDVHVYPTLVTIDEPDDALKPGMTAEVTLFVDERDHVLRLPVHAVLEVAGEKFCYVKIGRDIERRSLDTGLNNNRFIEIVKGLAEDEMVVQNPRALAERRGDLSAKARDPGERLQHGIDSRPPAQAAPESNQPQQPVGQGK